MTHPAFTMFGQMMRIVEPTIIPAKRNKRILSSLEIRERVEKCINDEGAVSPISVTEISLETGINDTSVGRHAEALVKLGRAMRINGHPRRYAPLDMREDLRQY